MTLSRRALLKGSGAAAAVVATAPALAMREVDSTLMVIDSRMPQSRALARLSAHTIDIAFEDAQFWQMFRSGPLPDRVVGLTAWSDWVVVRGFLEERGKRVRAETQRGALFHWTMS
jgi:hypothetical protein